MTIDNEQLISLLAERTGFDQGRINEQFRELVDRIQQAEEKQNTLHIEGFGTFKCINDLLEFEPSEVLETEINNKYTGMRPIELIGAFKEPGGEGVPVANLPEEQEVLDYKDLPEEQQQVDEPKAEKVDSAKEEQPETVQEVEVPVTETEVTESEESVGEEQKEAVPPAEPVGKEGDIAKTDESLQKDPLGKILLILAIIIALVVAVWMAYDLGLFGGNTGNSNTPPEPVEEQTETLDATTAPDTPEQASVNNSENSERSVSTTAATEGLTVSATENNESTGVLVEDTSYGLYGELNQDINRGYFTIVVHSLQTMDLAEEKKQVLVEEGFRTKINEASINNQTYFRVGIGQFSTVEAAQQAVQELPEPYKGNNFINRF